MTEMETTPREPGVAEETRQTTGLTPRWKWATPTLSIGGLAILWGVLTESPGLLLIGFSFTFVVLTTFFIVGRAWRRLRTP